MRSRIAIIISLLITITTYIGLTTATAAPRVPRNVVTHQSHHVASAPVATTAPSTTTTMATTTTQSAPPEASVNRDLYFAWTKVAVCEEGGWVGRSGDAYPNSLGITAANWYAFGGGSDVSPEAQIIVAERFRASIGMDIPDQNGCAAW
jgi:hypothetical protein